MDTESAVVIPLGRGASIHGTEASDDEDMAFDRRSLDLSDMCYIPRAASPAPSYLSMESDTMDCSNPEAEPDLIATRIQLEKSDSEASSVYSLESDEDVNEEMKPVLKVRRRPKNKKVHTGKPELVIDPNYKRHPALTFKFTFKFLQQVLKKLSEPQLKFFKKYLWERYPEYFRDPLDGLDILDLADKMLECCNIDLSLSITQHVFEYMGLKKLVSYICGHLKRNEVRYGLKQQLKEQYGTIHEGCPKEGARADLESVFVEHYITAGLYVPVNGEHELRGLVDELRVEQRFKYEPMKNTEIYNPKVVAERYLRLMVMRGIAGIGKTTAVHRFILDWVNETAHEEIYFLFPLSGTVLLPMLDEEKTLRELLNSLFPPLQALDDLEFEDCQLMFVLDSVDELLHRLDFLYTHCWSDVNTKVTVRILLINLIKGHMLHYAYLWVVSRPLSCCDVPNDRIHQVVEVRGFQESSREEYFRRRFSKDPDLAERMVNYLRANQTLFIMCHLPMFCWVASHVLQKVFQKYPPGQEPPSTITELYAYLVKVYFNVRELRRRQTPPEESEPCVEGQQCEKGRPCMEGRPCQKGYPWEDEKQLLMKISKVAFGMLEKEIFQMTKSHWNKEEAHPVEAIARCGLCTEYYREKFILYQEKIRCFIHPTVQEFLAALYVFLTYRNQGKNVLDTSKMSMMKLSGPSLADVYKCAVEKAVHSKAAAACHYDLFLRFLVGMGAESNQRILGNFMNAVGFKTSAVDDAAKVLRKKMKEHPDRKPNLEKCLEELYLTKNKGTN